MAPGAPLACDQPRVLWAARPNMLLLWIMASAAVGLAGFPLWAWLGPTAAPDCLGACEGKGMTILFGALALGLGLIGLPLALLIPCRGFDLSYRLLPGQLTIRRRLLGRVRSRDFAIPGHFFSPGRGNNIYVYPEAPGHGMKTILPCLSRRDRDALRDALPQGAWR